MGREHYRVVHVGAVVVAQVKSSYPAQSGTYPFSLAIAREKG